MNKRSGVTNTPDAAGYSVRPRPLIPRALRARVALAVATAAATGAVMAPAALAASPRETFCVHQPGTACVPAGAIDEGTDLQAALNTAELNSVAMQTPNVIDIGPGTFTAPSGGFTYPALNPLQVVGSGAGRTTLTGSGMVLALGYSGALAPPLRTLSVSNLSIDAAGGTGLLLQGGSADHLDITASPSTQLGAELVQASLSSSSVSAAGTFAAVATKNAQADISDDTIDAPGAWGIYTDGPATIHRTTVTAQYGLRDRAGPTYIDDSLIKAQYGLYAEDYAGEVSINALNDTVVAPPGASAGVVASGQRAGADVQILNSIVNGFPLSFQTIGGTPATIEGGIDNYDAGESGAGIHVNASIGPDPHFVDAAAGDYHLASDSPLLDASSTTDLGSISSTTDLDGNPRVVTVNRPSTPVDLGAYEYQPPASTPGGGTPGGGNPGGGTPSGGSPGTGTPGTGTPGTGTPGAGNHGGGTPGTSTPPRGSRPTKPATLKLIPLGRLAVAGNRMTLRLSCTGTAVCSGINVKATAMGVHHHKVTVGSLSTHLRAGHKATLALSLNRAGRTLLAKQGRLAVTLVVTVRDGKRTRTVETVHTTLHRLA